MGFPAREQSSFGISYRSSDEAFRRFDEVGTCLAFPGRAMIFEQSQCSSQVFVIRLGRVKLFSTSKEGRRMIIRVAGPGDILGLNAALNDLPYEVTAQTLEPSQLMGVRRGDLLWLLETCPDVGRKAAQVLANQYRELFLDTRRLALSGSASGRLARLLLDCATAVTDGEFRPHFTMVFTHEELANMVGTSRETVTRVLNQFERNRLVERQGASLVILDPSRLGKLAH
jgi:CRP/FNR family transcriptional regulator, cyclic AMP receptor protein